MKLSSRHPFGSESLSIINHDLNCQIVTGMAAKRWTTAFGFTLLILLNDTTCRCRGLTRNSREHSRWRITTCRQADRVVAISVMLRHALKAELIQYLNSISTLQHGSPIRPMMVLSKVFWDHQRHFSMNKKNQTSIFQRLTFQNYNTG